MMLYFKQVQLISDDGLVFENNDVTESFAFDNMKTDFTMEPSYPIFEVDIYSSRETQVMSRQYQKIMALCANLAGIANVLIWIELIIVMIVRDYSLMKRLVNFLYTFPMIKIPPKNFTIKNNDLTIKINPIETLEILQIMEKNSPMPTTERISASIPQKPFFPVPLVQKELMEDNTPDLKSEEKEFSPDKKEFPLDKN